MPQFISMLPLRCTSLYKSNAGIFARAGAGIGIDDSQVLVLSGRPYLEYINSCLDARRESFLWFDEQGGRRLAVRGGGAN